MFTRNNDNIVTLFLEGSLPRDGNFRLGVLRDHVTESFGEFSDIEFPILFSSVHLLIIFLISFSFAENILYSLWRISCRTYKDSRKYWNTFIMIILQSFKTNLRSTKSMIHYIVNRSVFNTFYKFSGHDIFRCI